MCYLEVDPVDVLDEERQVLGAELARVARVPDAVVAQVLHADVRLRLAVDRDRLCSEEKTRLFSERSIP